LVDYETNDGGAVAGKDYVAVKGTICFKADETRQEIQIQLIEKNIFTGVDNHHFYILLSNVRFAPEVHPSSAAVATSADNNQISNETSPIALTTPAIATVN
jgi:hypothetical protein